MEVHSSSILESFFGGFVMPAPGIVRVNEEDWKCTKCNGVNWCYCEGDDQPPEPICQCGWPGYACVCHREEEQYEFADD